MRPPSADEIETALSRFTWVAAGSILGLYVLSCVAGTVRLWGETAFPIAALLVYHFACYVSFTDDVYSFGEGDILVHMLENEATLLTMSFLTMSFLIMSFLIMSLLIMSLLIMSLLIMSLISGLQVGLAIYAWKVLESGGLTLRTVLTPMRKISYRFSRAYRDPRLLRLNDQSQILRCPRSQSARRKP
jgi:hypothetical protein